MTDASDTDDFALDAGQAVSLFAFLKEREDELTPSIIGIYMKIRDHLYKRLSIDEIERPETFLARIGRKP
jgi:hypothetical protein